MEGNGIERGNSVSVARGHESKHFGWGTVGERMYDEEAERRGAAPAPPFVCNYIRGSKAPS